MKNSEPTLGQEVAEKSVREVVLPAQGQDQRYSLMQVEVWSGLAIKHATKKLPLSAWAG